MGKSSSNRVKDSTVAASACEIEAFLDYGGDDVAEAFRGIDAVHPGARVNVEENPATPDPSEQQKQPERAALHVTGASILAVHWQQQHVYIRVLADGTRGELHLFNHIPTGNLVVVKKTNTRGQCRITDEAKMLKEYVRPHPNIIQLREVFFEPKPHAPSSCNIVMVYCSGGDVYEFTKYRLSEREEQVPEIFMLHFIASMGEALGYLHLGKRYDPSYDGIGIPRVIWDATHKPVLHQDVKLENIFLRWSPEYKYGLPDIILGDFDGAMLESETSTGFGTIGYYAPEVLKYQAIRREHSADWIYHIEEPIMTQASDIYTFGACLCYMMLWGNYERGVPIQPAFCKSNLKRWPLLLTLLENCLVDDPQKRPLSETLFNWAAVLKPHIRRLYLAGVRMPENSYPEQIGMVGDDSSTGQSYGSTPSSELDALIEEANGYSPDTSDEGAKVCCRRGHSIDSSRRRTTGCAPDGLATSFLGEVQEMKTPPTRSAPGMAAWI